MRNHLFSLKQMWTELSHPLLFTMKPTNHWSPDHLSENRFVWMQLVLASKWAEFFIMVPNKLDVDESLPTFIAEPCVTVSTAHVITTSYSLYVNLLIEIAIQEQHTPAHNFLIHVCTYTVTVYFSLYVNFIQNYIYICDFTLMHKIQGRI